MAKENNTDKAKQVPPIQIRISDQSLSALDAAAARNGRSRNAEAIARLEASVEPEAEQALALTAPLGAAIQVIGRYLGDWRQDRFAFDVLEAALAAFLARQRPAGSPVPHPNEANGGDLFFASDDSPTSAAKTVLGIAFGRTST